MGTHKVQKRVSSPLQVDLQAVVSFHVSPGNQMQIFCRSS